MRRRAATTCCPSRDTATRRRPAAEMRMRRPRDRGTQSFCTAAEDACGRTHDRPLRLRRGLTPRFGCSAPARRISSTDEKQPITDRSKPSTHHSEILCLRNDRHQDKPRIGERHGRHSSRPGPTRRSLGRVARRRRHCRGRSRQWILSDRLELGPEGLETKSESPNLEPRPSAEEMSRSRSES